MTDDRCSAPRKGTISKRNLKSNKTPVFRNEVFTDLFHTRMRACRSRKWTFRLTRYRCRMRDFRSKQCSQTRRCKGTQDPAYKDSGKVKATDIILNKFKSADGRLRRKERDGGPCSKIQALINAALNVGGSEKVGRLRGFSLAAPSALMVMQRETF